jgi:ABC-type phosphonate transport system ATPase subunit
VTVVGIVGENKSGKSGCTHNVTLRQVVTAGSNVVFTDTLDDLECLGLSS